MAVVQYLSRDYWNVVDGTAILLGRIAVAEPIELAQIVVHLVKKGAHAGTERLRLALYHDEALTLLYAASAWFSVLDLADTVPTVWRGRVPFDFERPFLSATKRYWVALETTGYTRNGSVFYIGAMYDWPYPINTQTDPLLYACAMEVTGYR